MRFCAMAFSRVVLTCSWLTTSENVCGRYLRAMTWYMRWASARPRVIRGTRAAPLPLLPSGPGGVCSRPLHGARDLTNTHPSTWVLEQTLLRSNPSHQPLPFLHALADGAGRTNLGQQSRDDRQRIGAGAEHFRRVM